MAEIGATRKRLQPTNWADPEVVRYVAWVSVWGHWLVWLVTAFLFAYRPGFWYHGHYEYLLLHVPLVTINGLVHYRLWTNRSVTWRWLLLLSFMDLGLITAGIVLQRGFEGFLFLAYYPSLTLFVLVFPSLWLGLAWTTLTAVVYVLVCLRVGLGIDLVAGDEKALMARLAAMYVIVICVSLIVRIERTRRQAAMERERHLQQERTELSQTIHDTAAQTAYMITLGIHRARELADKANEELMAALDATSNLSRSAMWELRQPIDAGHIFEGRKLGQVLWSHSSTFEKITAIPTRMSQSGTEPLLTVETRSRLFSIAHNALTNAYVHARPGSVEVRLDFEGEWIRLSVWDDGEGLPDDYVERGRGFNGMSADAERMGGTLTVTSERGGGGTTITCVVPHAGRES